MSIKDIKFRVWEPWQSYYVKNNCTETKSGVLCLFVHSIDLIEKIIHKPGFDPCTFISQNLKLEESQIRSKLMTINQKKDDDMDVDNGDDDSTTPAPFDSKSKLKFQKFSKHRYNFFTYQNIIYDIYSYIFIENEIDEQKKIEITKKKDVLFNHENKGTISSKIFCARYCMAIELAKYLEQDYFLTADNISISKKSKTKKAKVSKIYNPVEKYLRERHKKISNSVLLKSQNIRNATEYIPDVPLSNDVLNSDTDVDETLSLGYATVSEFLTMLLSSSFLIDMVVDKIPEIKVDQNQKNKTSSSIPDTKNQSPSISSRSSDHDNSVSETEPRKKKFSKKISNAEDELYKYFSEDEIRDNCTYFMKTHLIPTIFYFLWILKSCVKFCDRITTHQLGPVDPSNRFLTEAGYKGNPILFKKCSDDESEEILSALWRNILKLGKHFNMFGVENLDINDPEAIEKMNKVKLSDFDGYFVDDNWFSSLGIKKIPKKHNTKKEFHYFYELPVVDYDVTNLMKIINLISSKGCTMLDSQKFRYFMTCFWKLLDRITNSDDLIEYFSEKNGGDSKNTNSIPDSLEASMSLFPKYFAIELVKNKKKIGKNRFIEEDDEVIVVSPLFIHNSETILSYMIEGFIVSDYLHSTYVCKPPKLPCEDFCEKWLTFCNDICNDDNYSQFLKSKFSDIYWNRNQFYGECDNYNTSQKIVQANPVSNIMMDNRYRHHEICDKVCKYYPKEIFEFCIEKITACTNYNVDLRSLFSFCWDIHRLAIIKEPPSIYIKDVTEKFTRVKIGSNAKSITNGETELQLSTNSSLNKRKKSQNKNYGENDDNDDDDDSGDDEDQYKLIKTTIFDQSKSYNKEKEELNSIAMDLEIERKHVSESEFSQNVFKGYSMGSKKSNMLSDDVTLGSEIFTSESLLDRALDKRNSYKNALESIRNETRSLFLSSIILEDDENTESTSLDTAYFVRKTQHLPVGLIEFNVLQESILYIISFKNTKILNENSIDTNILKTEDDLEDLDNIIETDEKTMLSYPTFDSRDMINEENFPVYDHLFGTPDTVIDSNRQTTVDHLVKGKGRNTNVFKNKNNVSITDYWGSKKKFGVNENEEDFDDGEISDEDDVTRRNNQHISVTEEISRSYGVMLEDEEFGMDNESYEKLYRDKENYKRRFSGIDKNEFRELRNLKANNLFKKEWPDIMNYDILQQRSKEEAGNLEFPLTILECSSDIKRHSLFRRSKKDKPCMFMFFNNYYLCDGKNLYSTRFATKLPLLSINSKFKKKGALRNLDYENDEDCDEDSENIAQNDQYYSDSEEEYNYFIHEDAKFNGDKEKIEEFTTNELPFTTPYDIGALLGTLIDRFEKSTDELTVEFYKILRSQEMTIKLLTEDISEDDDGETVYNKRQSITKREEEFKQHRTKMISEIQKNYGTFPEIISNSTLPYKRKFDPTSKIPISKIEQDH